MTVIDHRRVRCGSGPCGLRALLLLAVLAPFVVGCGDDTIAGPPGAAILEFDQTSILIQVQETVELSVRVLDHQGNPIADVPDGWIEWFSSNDAIVHVENGMVLGIRPGVAVVGARAGNLLPAEVMVQVEPRPLSGRLSFQYEGSHTGSFDVDSEFILDPEHGPIPPDWVATFFFSTNQSQDIVAEAVRDNGLIDIVWLWVNFPVTSEITLPLDGAHVVLGFDGETEGASFGPMANGVITFTSVTSARMVGTFQFSVEHEASGILEVRSGSFDAPRVTEAEIFTVPPEEGASGVPRRR